MSSLSQRTQPAQRPPIPELIDLHDENVKLRDTLQKVQSDYDLLTSLIALSETKIRTLSEEQKNIMVLNLGLTKSLLTSRAKRIKKSIPARRRELYRYGRRLGGTAVSLDDGSGPQESCAEQPSLEGDASSGGRSRPVRGSDFNSHHGANLKRVSNILRPVDSTQLPNDDVLVEMNGQTISQRQLTQWYRATDMRADKRRIFEAKNSAINHMRRNRQQGQL